MRNVLQRIHVVEGDITREQVDAIVNAANEGLLGGGGVDGAIHRAAGPELLAACRLLGGCPTGGACITPGFRLPARYVIHTVGPVWHGGFQGEPGLLASAYRSSLLTAGDNACRTVAFPAISTGVYGYPADMAAQIAVKTIATFLAEQPDDGFPQEVRLVAFSASSRQVLEEALHALARQEGPWQA
ncbi:O-acetyl-ADP-ribose deacetylase [uncultured Desulfovibrio sp.]|uniref:O-acetyl-ADP-ribose deacetylase n=1 Tax=uncultured Desulfovibrio sp. TaxID=167968 RepID=UPI00261C5073|nr:O-acetyl-ADP-ribose deacetylase [uncultured Desulfovibrio sp.]